MVYSLSSVHLVLVRHFSIVLSVGANDVANAFATSVGSGALSLGAAIVIAAIMEFSGAFLLGGNVASTIMKGIANTEDFADEPEVLMFGMMCVVIGVAAWLIIATMYGLPVSTTHSCIGGIVGMTVVAKGMKSVKWGQVGLVALSWLVTPVLSALLSTCIFWCVRKFILRQNEPLKKAYASYPIIVGFTIALNLFLVLFKSSTLNISLPWWGTALICLAIGVVISLILQFTFMPYVKRKIAKEMERENDEIAIKNTSVEIEMVEKSAEVPVVVIQSEVKEGEKSAPTTESAPAEESAPAVEGEVKIDNLPTDTKKSTKMDQLKEKQNIHAELEDEKSKVYQMHKNAEVFDASTEKLFTYLQIITAIFNSFAHGANDVANAIGPFAACIAIYNTGSATAEATVYTGVLVLGGFGIVVGLACLGYKVMASIGVNMVKITPSRGFSIEIGSALIVLIGSALSYPLSTTHCKVGSTVGVGLVEGKNGVNWSLLYGVFAGWIITIVICAITTGLLFAFAVYSPKLLSL